MSAPDRGSTDRVVAGTDLGTAVALFAATAVVVLGAGSGVPVPTALAAAAGVFVGVSVSLLGSRGLARRTVGSCGLAGGIALGVVAVLGGGPLAATALLASGGTALALVPPDGRLLVLRRTFRDASVGAIVVALAATVAVAGWLGPTLAVGRALLGMMTASAYGGFVSLLLLLAAALLLVATAGTLLEEATSTELSIPTLETLAEQLSDVPNGAFFVVVFFVIVLRFEGTARTFASTLETLGPVGSSLEFVLTSGLVHVPLATLALVAAFVYAAVAAWPVATVWLGSYPLRTLSLASGGVLLALLAFAVSTATAIGSPAASVWSAVALVAVALLVVEVVARGAVQSVPGWLSSRRLLGVGAGALFAMAILGATIGLEPLLVFAGVAASIVLWDVGENALSMRTQIGERIDTRQTELVHATATAFVGLGGVALAAVAMYGIGSVAPPSSRWQAVAPVALALAAVIAFTFAIVRREGELSPRWLRDGGNQVGRPPGHPFSSVVALSMGLSIAMFVAGNHGLGRILLVIGIFGTPLVFVVIVERMTALDSSPAEDAP